MLALLTWLAECDGRISPREQALLDQIAQAIDDEAELASVEAALRQPSPGDLELACRHLRNNLDRISRKLLAQLAVTIATADGHLTVGENLVLQFLADLLGLSPRQFARLFEQIAHRPFPLPGDVSSIDWWRQRESGLPAKAGQVISAAGQEDITTTDEPMTRAAALRILGLEVDAPSNTVHKAYRRLARTRHPDRFTPLGTAAVATASEAFKRLHEAYQLLSTPQPR